VAYAASDEPHQIFVHGRGTSPVDVLIDAIRAAGGIGAYRLVRRRGVDSRL
jgi:VanZ family protein